MITIRMMNLMIIMSEKMIMIIVMELRCNANANFGHVQFTKM